MKDNTLIKYLKLCERIEASDLHIKSGKCAIARVAGALKQIDDTVLTREQVFSFIQDILTEKQMVEFEQFCDVVNIEDAPSISADLTQLSARIAANGTSRIPRSWRCN